ncbi:hypothetical protein CEXT_574691 [Caerostris extrusa]|uniref:Ycf15 n=1 Tax=Caerostris extrusa TaxID=172846 RepID=A0AAV4P2Q8_CAEEX|nr:hypothetical protein CEXT_574691 [Caerostris extrusa]
MYDKSGKYSPSSMAKSTITQMPLLRPGNWDEGAPPSTQRKRRAEKNLINISIPFKKAKKTIHPRIIKNLYSPSLIWFTSPQSEFSRERFQGEERTVSLWYTQSMFRFAGQLPVLI